MGKCKKHREQLKESFSNNWLNDIRGTSTPIVRLILRMGCAKLEWVNFSERYRTNGKGHRETLFSWQSTVNISILDETVRFRFLNLILSLPTFLFPPFRWSLSCLSKIFAILSFIRSVSEYHGTQGLLQVSCRFWFKHFYKHLERIYFMLTDDKITFHNFYLASCMYI